VKRLAVGVVLLLLAAGCGVLLTSNWALRRLWLPRVAAAAGVELRVAHADWEPLSSLTLRGVEFSHRDGWRGRLAMVRFEYTPTGLSRASMRFQRVVAVDGELHRVEPVDVPSHGEAAVAAPQAAPAPDPERKAGRPQRARRTVVRAFDPGELIASNVTLTVSAPSRDPGRCRVVSLRLDPVAAGRTTRAVCEASFEGAWGAAWFVDAGKVRAAVEFTTAPDGSVKEFSGNVALVDWSGRHGASVFSNVSATAEAMMSGYRLRTGIVAVTVEGREAGGFRATGPLDFGKRDADILVENGVAGAALLDLLAGCTGVGCTNGSAGFAGQFRLTRGAMRVQGEVRASGIELHGRGGVVMPRLDGVVRLAGERRGDELVLDRVEARVQQDGKPLVDATLNRPVVLKPGGAPGQSGGELAFTLAPVRLEYLVAPWPAGARLGVRDGTISGRGVAALSVDGRRLSVDARASLENVTATWGEAAIERAKGDAAIVGTCEDFETFDLARCTLTLADGGGPRLLLDGKGRGGARQGSFQTAVSGDARMLGPWVRDRLVVRRGGFQAAAQGAWTNAGACVVTVQGGLDRLSGEWRGLRADGGALSGNATVEHGAAGTSVRAAELRFAPISGVEPGIVSWVADRDPSGRVVRAQWSLSGWSQGNLVPAVEPLLGGATLQLRELSGAGEMEMGGDQRRLAAELRAIGFELRDAGDAGAETRACDVQAVVRASGPDRWNIEQADFSIGPDRLTVSGWLVDPGRFALEVTGDRLDLAPWAGWWSRESGRDDGSGREAGGVVSKKVGGASNAVERARADVRPSAAPTERREAGKNSRDRSLAIRLKELALPQGGVFLFECGWKEQGGTVVLSPFALRGGDASLTGSLAWDRSREDAPLLVGVRAVKFPLRGLRGFVDPSAHAWLSGEATCDANLGGTGRTWKKARRTLAGRAEIAWKEARIERVPPVKSVLRTINRNTEDAFKSARFPEASAAFEVKDGVARTTNLVLAGEMLRLHVAGSAEMDGDVDMNLGLAVESGVLQRLRLRAGPVMVGGATLQSLGTAEGKFTRLPGELPVRGSLKDDLEADWEAWVIKFGVDGVRGGGAVRGLLDALIQPPNRKRGGKK
jgi:hypothetical protein